MSSEGVVEAKCHCLPDDLISNILVRLPVKSIVRFRCVSKSWFSITTQPSFLLDHTSRSPNFILIHTIKHLSEDSNLRHVNLQLLPPSAATVFPERRRRTTDVVVASCDGLLCLLDKRYERLYEEGNVHGYYVLNPLTGTQINVSRSTCSVGYLMGFYFHPPTCEYRLIRRITSNNVFDKVELISVGGEAWRTIDSSPPRGSVCARTPIDLNGILYWIACNTTEFKASGILGFDIIREEFMLLPLPSENMRIFGNSSLIDMGKILGLLIIDRELSSMSELGIDIWVVKGFENVEWEKKYSVRCFSGIDRIEFKFGYWVGDIALCTRKEEIVVLFVGPRSYLVQFDLKAMKYCTVLILDPVLDPEILLWHFSLFYKESLVSHDSFQR